MGAGCCVPKYVLKQNAFDQRESRRYAQKKKKGPNHRVLEGPIYVTENRSQKPGRIKFVVGFILEAETKFTEWNLNCSFFVVEFVRVAVRFVYSRPYVVPRLVRSVPKESHFVFTNTHRVARPSRDGLPPKRRDEHFPIFFPSQMPADCQSMPYRSCSI